MLTLEKVKSPKGKTRKTDEEFYSSKKKRDKKIYRYKNKLYFNRIQKL